MPTYPSIYRFRVLAAAVMASVSIYLFSASLGMDVLKSSEVLADIYPENMNDYASRLTAEEKFQDELFRQLTDKIYLERYSICALILALAIFFLPSPVVVRRSRVLLVFSLATPVSIVLSEVLATSLSLDRMLYPTWRDNIVVAWFVSCAVAFAVCFMLLPLLIIGWRSTSGGLIFRSKTTQVLSGILLAVWLVGFACSFSVGIMRQCFPMAGVRIFTMCFPPAMRKHLSINRCFEGLSERISSA